MPGKKASKRWNIWQCENVSRERGTQTVIEIKKKERLRQKERKTETDKERDRESRGFISEAELSHLGDDIGAT